MGEGVLTPKSTYEGVGGEILLYYRGLVGSAKKARKRGGWKRGGKKKGHREGSDLSLYSNSITLKGGSVALETRKREGGEKKSGKF